MVSFLSALFRKIWYIFAFIQFTVLIVTYNLLIYFIKENPLRGIFKQNLCAFMYICRVQRGLKELFSNF